MNSRELKERFNDLKPLSKIELATIWGNRRKNIRKHVKTGDAEAFLTWSTIKATMFIGQCQTTLDEAEEIKKSPRWEDYATKALMENKFGQPMRMGMGLTYTSGGLIHQTYHLMMWENTTQRHIEDLKVIVEFGGGYGAMCAIAHRLGFDGEYYLVDLPELSLLQEYYMSNLGFEANYVSCDADTDFRTSDLPYNADLLMALHSFSEAPISQRDNFMSAIVPSSWLFSYQARFDEVDNESWFRKLADTHKGYVHQFFFNRHRSGIKYLVSWIEGLNAQN